MTMSSTQVLTQTQHLHEPVIGKPVDLSGCAPDDRTSRASRLRLVQEVEKPGILRTRPYRTTKSHLVKRTLDYLLGIPLFLLSLPILAFFVGWIKIVSPGPAIFVQARDGRGGKRIGVLKLRTMYLDSEALLQRHLAENPLARAEWHRYYKLRNDPRVLPGIGRLLRKTSLDELPQLWNVLRGEMTLVGPRPFPDYHLINFPVEFLAFRHSVLPGMTGLWQVRGRSNGGLKVQKKLDSYYIRNWSVWMDFAILYNTFWVVLKGKGAY